MTRLRRQLAELRTRYTDEHPDVRAVLARLQTLEQEARTPTPSNPAAVVDPAVESARSQLQKARLEVKDLEAKRQAVQENIVRFQARVEEAPRTEQEIATLTRDYRQLNDNYLKLLNRKMDAQMSERLENRWKGERFSVLDPARLPEKPYFPNLQLFATVGLLLGLVAGVGLALLADALDHSLKSPTEVEAVLPYPLLVTIPHVSKPSPVAVAPVARRA